MKLKIKPLNKVAESFYQNHGHFHDGDAGLDLYILESQIFRPGETKVIKLGIWHYLIILIQMVQDLVLKFQKLLVLEYQILKLH